MATSTSNTTRTLRLERRFSSAPERVYAAWTTPEEMNRWCAPGPLTAEVEADVRVGGVFRIAMEGPDGERYRVHGTYREVVPPRRLVYTWQWDEPAESGESVVTVEFQPLPNGGTNVILLHEGLDSEESRKNHAEGWEGCLAKLEGVTS